MKRPRILLADDHVLLAQALEHLLRADFDVVGTVADGRALLRAAAELSPDVVVVDIGMPLLNGLDAGEQLKALHPGIKVIFLTQNREPRFAVEAFRRHASGYLLKDSAASELTTAIREALRGNTYVSPLVAKGMVDESVGTDVGHITLRQLSGREREVPQLLARAIHRRSQSTRMIACGSGRKGGSHRPRSRTLARRARDHAARSDTAPSVLCRGNKKNPRRRAQGNAGDGAGNGIRTRDFDLGKVALYH